MRRTLVLLALFSPSVMASDCTGSSDPTFLSTCKKANEGDAKA